MYNKQKIYIGYIGLTTSALVHCLYFHIFVPELMFSVHIASTTNFIVTLFTIKGELKSPTKLCYVAFKVMIIDV